MPTSKTMTLFVFLAVFWSVTVGLSAWHEIAAVKEQSLALARVNAETAVAKDIIYRKWMASKGGVYARVDKATPPNPYLDEVKVSNKVITGSDGAELTLVNPAYMTRQVHEMSREFGFIDGHLTSLIPINPDNQASDWERLALEAFERGEREYVSITDDAVPQYRYMKAIMTEQSCLQCHQHQGYELGQVRGGLSVSFPMTEFLVQQQATIKREFYSHGTIWLLGLALIAIGGWKVVRKEARLLATNNSLVAAIDKQQSTEAELIRERDEQQQLLKRLQLAQKQLVQSEKLAGIGQLSAGVAHEINNPVGFIGSNVNCVRDYTDKLTALIDEIKTRAKVLENAEIVTEMIEQIQQSHDYHYIRADLADVLQETRDGVERIRKIVADLKGFSRISSGEWKSVDLHQEIDSTLNVVWNELKYHCKVEKAYGDMPPVECLSGEISQVIMNLLMNASHAIKGQGTITIRTGATDNQVWVAVEDTGQGIAPEIIGNIFDPFFTTKPVGKGTGLGLSVSYGIVQKHGGRLEVESTPGVGTTFTMTLPLRRALSDQREADREPAAASAV